MSVRIRVIPIESKDVYEDHVYKDMEFSTGRPVELDVFVPSRLLAFEYQGEAHYFDIYSIGPRHLFERRDEEKRELCQIYGLTLIEVPYWWDFEIESLKTTIHLRRPDLGLAAKGYPILEKPPRNQSERGKS